MSKTWKKDGRTFDTDRYNSVYRVVEDRFYKNVWSEGLFVGPNAYNRSHVALIIGNQSNDVNYIVRSANPLLDARAILSTERVKFTP